MIYYFITNCIIFIILMLVIPKEFKEMRQGEFMVFTLVMVLMGSVIFASALLIFITGGLDR